MVRLFAAICLWLIGTALFGQVAVELLPRQVIDSRGAEVISGVMLLPADAEIRPVPAMLVHVQTDFRWARIKARADGKIVRGVELQPGQWLFVEPGRYLLDVTVFDPDRGIDGTEAEFTIGPAPPSPPPGPDPPQPPDPQPLADLTVLVVYQTEDMPRMPRAQQAIIMSTEFRQWLGGKVTTDPQSRTANFRFLDADTRFAVCESRWCKLFDLPRTSLPWIVIANGPTPVYQGPLPGSVEEAKALIGRYAR